MLLGVGVAVAVGVGVTDCDGFGDDDGLPDDEGLPEDDGLGLPDPDDFGVGLPLPDPEDLGVGCGLPGPDDFPDGACEPPERPALVPLLPLPWLSRSATRFWPVMLPPSRPSALLTLGNAK